MIKSLIITSRSFRSAVDNVTPMIAFIYSVQNLVNFATMPAVILLPSIEVVLLDEITYICYNIADGNTIVFMQLSRRCIKCMKI